MLRSKMSDTTPTHVFTTMEEQTAQSACLLHSCSAAGCQSAQVCPDLAVTGTPCHPYSKQRAKRFLPNSVTGHDEFKVTFSSLLDWYRTFEPRCVVAEQVMGFDMVEHSGSTVTPYERRVLTCASSSSSSSSCGGGGGGGEKRESTWVQQNHQSLTH